MSWLLSGLGLLVLIGVSAIAVILLCLVALGAMHQHLIKRGEAFGNGVTPEQLEEKIHAAVAANNKTQVH